VRAPGLISVRDPGWFRVGDMMVDGVIPRGERCGRSVYDGRPGVAGGRSLAAPGIGASTIDSHAGCRWVLASVVWLGVRSRRF